jgi:hypothetical protein
MANVSPSKPRKHAHDRPALRSEVEYQPDENRVMAGLEYLILLTLSHSDHGKYARTEVLTSAEEGAEESVKGPP